MKPIPRRSQPAVARLGPAREPRVLLCSETNGATRRSSATARASSTIAAVKRIEPTARTFPSCTSSSSAPSVSSTGVTPSGRWYW